MKLIALLAALQAFGPAQGKKCVTIGWEFIYTSPSAIAEHAEAYRGCGLSGAVFNLFGTSPDGRKLNTNTLPEDPSWMREAFAADEAALKKLAAMPEFAHSFIDAVRCPRKRHAWTDDAFWTDYREKVRIVASIARATGMVGVAVDNEDYGSSRQFYLRPEDDGSYADVARLARRRGREIFTAIFEEFPDAKIHFDRMYSNELWNYYYGADDPRALAEDRGDLWTPFMDGAMDALPPTGLFYEGDETGYRYDAGHHDALLARSRNQIDLARVAAPELREKYRSQVRLALPIYLDRYTRQDPKSRYWCAPVAGSLVGAFERNFSDALAASDDYVWLYQELSFFGEWTRPAGNRKGPYAWLPTWESCLPGLTDILNAAQHPKAFAERRLSDLAGKGSLCNILPESFGDGALPAPLGGWQAKEQPGTFGAKSGCFFAGGVGRGGISWTTRDVREGDLYAITYEVRGNVGFTQVNFHRTDGVHDLSFPVPRMFAPPVGSGSDWRKFVAAVRVPGDVESMLVSLSVGQKPGERTEFRKVGFYRLMRIDGHVPQPIEVTAEGEEFSERLVRSGSSWIGERVSVRLEDRGDGTAVRIQAPSAALKAVRFKWSADFREGERIYTEKTRGGWSNLGDHADSLFFFLIDRRCRTEGWGVKTQPNAFVSWTARPGSVEAVFDVRAGGRGVRLGKRELEAAVLLHREGTPGEPAFAAGQAFCRMMCPVPRLPKEPVYGYNDWYCAYGANTATNFLADAAYVAEMAKGLKVRPYVVMDDGWQENSPPMIKKETGTFDSGCGPWDRAGAAFGMDMKTFAAKIAALGAKPGLWYRPMRAWREVPESQRLAGDSRFFDPTVPEVKKRIFEDVKRFREWGFKLVKSDYITYDFCGQYMHNVRDIAHIMPDGLRWRDESRTTAEVMLDIYRTIREAAGDGMVVIGCNAVNHFVPGLFEIQRTGRDTSGWSWQKTAECGVNALGMRSFMNGTFYAADPDCVGLAKEGAVPWGKNREWLDAIARSKSPLFISWKRSLATPEVRAAFREAFAEVCRPGKAGEPIDWQAEELPSKWKFETGEKSYDWFSAGSLGSYVHGRRELFNGKDLSNWYTYLHYRGREYDPLDVFSVSNGVIHCTGEELGCITTCEEFSDYRLEVEFRWTGEAHLGKLKNREAPDSGILFHCTGPDGEVNGYWMLSHEYNLILGGSGDFWTVGASNRQDIALTVEVAPEKLFGYAYVWQKGGKRVRLTDNERVCRFDIARDWSNTVDCRPAVNERPMGEWNLATLVCKGETVKCYFNGKLVNEAVRVSPARGKIQLQSEGCGVDFRRVTIFDERQ